MDSSNVHHYTIDIVAVGTITGAFLGALPAIATIFAIVWYGVQLYTWYQDRKQITAKRKKKR